MEERSVDGLGHGLQGLGAAQGEGFRELSICLGFIEPVGVLGLRGRFGMSDLWSSLLFWFWGLEDSAGQGLAAEAVGGVVLKSKARASAKRGLVI